MSGLFSYVYENVTSSYLATALSNGISSITSTVIDNFGTVVPIAALLGAGTIGALGAISGLTVSMLTCRYVQLNSFVPLVFRRAIRNTLGKKLIDANECGAQLVSRVLPIEKEAIRLTIVAPIVEEFVFRFPLLICSWAIDSLVPESAQVGKVALAVISSIGFVYVHNFKPDAGLAANQFAGGLAFSYLAIHPEGGLRSAIIAHIFHNTRYVLINGVPDQNRLQSEVSVV